MAAPSAARTSHHEPAFYGNANFIAQWSTEEILQVMQDDLEAHLVLTPLLEQEQEHLKLFMALEHNSLNQSYKVLASSKLSASALIKLGQSFKNCGQDYNLPPIHYAYVCASVLGAYELFVQGKLLTAKGDSVLDLIYEFHNFPKLLTKAAPVYGASMGYSLIQGLWHYMEGYDLAALHYLRYSTYAYKRHLPLIERLIKLTAATKQSSRYALEPCLGLPVRKLAKAKAWSFEIHHEILEYYQRPQGLRYDASTIVKEFNDQVLPVLKKSMQAAAKDSPNLKANKAKLLEPVQSALNAWCSYFAYGAQLTLLAADSHALAGLASKARLQHPLKVQIRPLLKLSCAQRSALPLLSLICQKFSAIINTKLSDLLECSCDLKSFDTSTTEPISQDNSILAVSTRPDAIPTAQSLRAPTTADSCPNSTKNQAVAPRTASTPAPRAGLIHDAPQGKVLRAPKTKRYMSHIIVPERSLNACSRLSLRKQPLTKVPAKADAQGHALYLQPRQPVAPPKEQRSQPLLKLELLSVADAQMSESDGKLDYSQRFEKAQDQLNEYLHSEPWKAEIINLEQVRHYLTGQLYGYSLHDINELWGAGKQSTSLERALQGQPLAAVPRELSHALRVNRLGLEKHRVALVPSLELEHLSTTVYLQHRVDETLPIKLHTAQRSGVSLCALIIKASNSKTLPLDVSLQQLSELLTMSSDDPQLSYTLKLMASKRRKHQSSNKDNALSMSLGHINGSIAQAATLIGVGFNPLDGTWIMDCLVFNYDDFEKLIHTWLTEVKDELKLEYALLQSLYFGSKPHILIAPKPTYLSLRPPKHN